MSRGVAQHGEGLLNVAPLIAQATCKVRNVCCFSVRCVAWSLYGANTHAAQGSR